MTNRVLLKETGRSDVRDNVLAALYNWVWKVAAFIGLVSVSTVQGQTVQQVLPVARVWPGHPVGFCLLTQSNQQYVAYYDADRSLTVASRSLKSTNWSFTRLPERVVWDSHNYVTMTMDAAGELHLSGNMHGGALVYFRTTRPLLASSLERIPDMVGRDEARTTYPEFMQGPENGLLFAYRSGSSGNGNQLFNIYDLKTKTWRRLLDKPLLDGAGQKSAYLNGPRPGPDGWVHLCWVWRETPACETSHYICYARSRDWVHWENSRGQKQKLPVTFESDVVVDPVPPLGGVINGNLALGFDAQHRPILSYHKYDSNGVSQIYNARLENGAWRIRQATNWKHRWEFSGGGSIEFDVRVGAVSLQSDGALTQQVWSRKTGSQTSQLNEATLQPVSDYKIRPSVPPEMRRCESKFPGMQVHVRAGHGDGGLNKSRFWLRWETLPPNRDKPREGPLPPPGWLTVWEIIPPA